MKGHETNDATYYTRLKCLEEKKARKKQGGAVLEHQCGTVNPLKLFKQIRTFNGKSENQI